MSQQEDNLEKARENYKNRKVGRLKQTWDKENRVWVKTPVDKRNGE